MDVQANSFFAYWGKARPDYLGADAYHLLAFHSLDVAATGRVLLQQSRYSLAPMARDLGWPLERVEALAVFFLALHDVGKFARAFQSLAPNLSSALVSAMPGKSYDERHDTLGWLAWRDVIAADLSLPSSSREFWNSWICAVVGHHGKPPKENTGLVPLRSKKFFLTEDLDAASAWTQAMATIFLPSTPWPTINAKHEIILQKHSWRLAGLAVLADWLGSHQGYFPYRSRACDLADYWQTTALPAATRVVRDSGVSPSPVRTWVSAKEVLPHLDPPTPLQDYASTVDLGAGPQLFLLEDVTGAGKTEAALILAHRLMAEGRADGFYFGLPTMATANQMYERVGGAYGKFYQSGAHPSLVLAHGARQWIDAFRDSVISADEAPGDRNYAKDDVSATAQCTAWLADSRKKALLADVGVGTIDQALLAAMPARHQAMRLLGLAGKVLVVDEVHAYDSYMTALLASLLRAHAKQGGNAILLSATMPATLRERLARAFASGRSGGSGDLAPDAHYPLATQVGDAVKTVACGARPITRRRVELRFCSDRDSVLTMIETMAHSGRCVGWIRNTVADARQAYAALRARLPRETVHLFHSRFAMGDRLTIERDVLRRFGRDSTASDRRGQVVVATQVIEQSLDIDLDVIVTDLCPVDLLIQRAGRLQRHARRSDGMRSNDGTEHRPTATLWIYGPTPDPMPSADWYASYFPGGRFVYPHVGRLWLTSQALQRAGAIASPGELDDPASVRSLVEAVYGENATTWPDTLAAASNKAEGEGSAASSQGVFNSLDLTAGYRQDSASQWYDDAQVATRLGEATIAVFLARASADGQLHPWCAHPSHPWDMSSLSLRASQVRDLSPAWLATHGDALAGLRQRHRVLESGLVLPLVEVEGSWVGEMVDKQGRVRQLVYDTVDGLAFQDKTTERTP